MDKDQIFWLVVWALAAIVAICGLRGCVDALELDARRDKEMADRGYEYVCEGWIRR